jgi:hypothetical protein
MHLVGYVGMREGKCGWIAKQRVRGDSNDVVGEEAGMRHDGDSTAQQSGGDGET